MKFIFLLPLVLLYFITFLQLSTSCLMRNVSKPVRLVRTDECDVDFDYIYKKIAGKKILFVKLEQLCVNNMSVSTFFTKETEPNLENMFLTFLKVQTDNFLEVNAHCLNDTKNNKMISFAFVKALHQYLKSSGNLYIDNVSDCCRQGFFDSKRMPNTLLNRNIRFYFGYNNIFTRQNFILLDYDSYN